MTVRRLTRVAFSREVPSPRTESFSRTNWISTFAEPEFAVVLEADIVRVTHRETGRTYAYPLAGVAGFEEPAAPLRVPPVNTSTLASPAPPMTKKGAAR